MRFRTSSRWIVIGLDSSKKIWEVKMLLLYWWWSVLGLAFWIHMSLNWECCLLLFAFICWFEHIWTRFLFDWNGRACLAGQAAIWRKTRKWWGTNSMFSIDAILWDHIAWAIQPFFLGIFANRIWILVWYSLAMPSIGVEHKKPY